jgi:hypothetical protein
LGIVQESFSFFLVKKGAFHHRKTGEHPKKTALAPGVFIGGNQLASIITKTVQVAAVFGVQAAAHPEMEQIFRQFLTKKGKVVGAVKWLVHTQFLLAG